MLVKCETRSPSRIKGLSFHPTLSWVLASQYNGAIQLWDYHIGSLIHRFEAHEGPCRSVDFHLTQPMFVSGGDDNLVKVWDYKQRRLLFELDGHHDYVRSVQFHKDKPWILSASDDLTAIIFNWQSRKRIAVLAAHTHYVMSARFHPSLPLVVTSCMDTIVRVWDTSVLDGPSNSIGSSSNGKRDTTWLTEVPCKYELEGHDTCVNWADFSEDGYIVSASDDRTVRTWRMGGSTAWQVESYRAHNGNVVSALFVPNTNYILSCGEDQTVRVWDSKRPTNPIYTMRREHDRFWVACAHPKINLLAVGHESGILVFKLHRERPAYALTSPTELIFSTIPSCNAFMVNLPALPNANGTSSTLMKAPTAGPLGEISQSGMLSLPFSRPMKSLNGGPFRIIANPHKGQKNEIIVVYSSSEKVKKATVGGGNSDEEEECKFEYDVIIMDGGANGGCHTVHSFHAAGAVFVARGRMAVLNYQSQQIQLINTEKQVLKSIPVPSKQFGKALTLFPGGQMNRVIIKCKEKTVLFDTSSGTVLGSVTNPAGGFRAVEWSASLKQVALLAKHAIVIANGDDFSPLCPPIHESVRIKSAVWANDVGVLVYATINHIKYMIPSGDGGILRSVAQPIYLVRVAGNRLIVLTRAGTLHEEELPMGEISFKIALLGGNFEQVADYISKQESKGSAGNYIVSYLKKKNQPEVALQLVKDPLTRFNLAAQYGNLTVAAQAAEELNEPETWTRLASVATNLGRFSLVEKACRAAGALDRLAHSLFLQGDREGLKNLASSKDVNFQVRHQAALLLGDVALRAKVLASAGQIPLALALAKTHNLTQVIPDLQALFDESFKGTATECPQEQALRARLNGGAPPALLIPPPVIYSSKIHFASTGGDWPLTRSREELFSEGAFTNTAAKQQPDALEFHKQAKQAFLKQTRQQNTSEKMFDCDDGENTCEFAEVQGGQDGDWGEIAGLAGASGDLGLDLGDLGLDVANLNNQTSSTQQAATSIMRNESVQKTWSRTLSSPAELVAAGEFKKALQVLHTRIGIANSEPLRALFKQAFIGAWAAIPNPVDVNSAAGQVYIPFTRTAPEGSAESKLSNCGSNGCKPHSSVVSSKEGLLEILRQAYALVTPNFETADKAVDVFRDVIARLCLVAVGTKKDESDYNTLLQICKDYITALRCMLTHKSITNPASAATLISKKYIADPNKAATEPYRSLDLLCFTTCCRLQKTHLLPALRVAMVAAFKSENFMTAASLAERLIAQNPPAQVLPQIQGVLAQSQARGTDSYPLQFDPRAQEYSKPGGAINLCVVSLEPLTAADAIVKCGLCQSQAKKEFERQCCPTCNIATLGARVLGHSFMV
eukprot:GDKJ01007995.1.p1 GENE.GDKJ01007995.1~~GDKJ01007995.1.p1  ORF type:complete len:1350 (+),score=328.49 GDKJ01007995.1:45-4094(+)